MCRRYRSSNYQLDLFVFLAEFWKKNLQHEEDILPKNLFYLPKDIEGAVVYVYTPEMLAIEKLRAICQQNPDYRNIIFSKAQTSRARDFYDIYNLAKSFSIDFSLIENIDLCKNIFDAKRVPYGYIQDIKNQRELHRESWESVINTVGINEELKDFDYYFDFVIQQFKHIS